MITAAEALDGGRYVAFFNQAKEPYDAEILLSQLGLSGEHTVRDLWQRRDLGTVSTSVTVAVPSHGARLIKLTPPTPVQP